MPEAVYYIPAGPKNLAVLFPTINWGQVQDYYIEILAGSTVIATTPLYQLGCCCDSEDIIIHFLNYAGTYDQVSFQKPNITHESTNSIYEKQLNYPLDKKDFGQAMFNSQSNDTWECKNTCLGEDNMTWIQELFDSTSIFLQVNGKEGLADGYIPVIKLDAKFDKEKNDSGASSNVVVFKFKLANDFKTQRG